ncbi:hypothetical protein Tco_0566213 [Tanacetum coccineum]
MPPPSYRGCWHGVSRGFFLESCHDRALDERALQAALPFFTHAILLDRAFAHCPRFPTAAPRGSPGRVSVPVWLIIRKDQLSIIGLLPENNVRLACVKHIASVPSEPGSNSSFDYDLALQCLVIDILEKLVKSRQTLSKAMVARNGFSQREEKVFRLPLWLDEGLRLASCPTSQSILPSFGRVKRLKKQEQKQSLERGEHLPTLWFVYTIQHSEPIPFRFILVCWEDEEMNFGIQLQRNSARIFRVGKVPALLGQAVKALFLMKSTLQSLPLFLPCPGPEMVGLKWNSDEIPRSGWRERQFLSSHGRRRIRKEESRVKKKGNGILHKGREHKGGSTNKSEKGSKEGTHLDRATTEDKIWKEINIQYEPHVIASREKKAARNHDPLALVAHSNVHSSHSHTSPSYSHSPQPYYVTHPSTVIDNEEDYQGEIQGDAQEDKLITAMMEQMLLEMKDEAGGNLNEKENDFMLDNHYGNDSLEELNAALIMMTRIQPTDDKADC